MRNSSFSGCTSVGWPVEPIRGFPLDGFIFVLMMPSNFIIYTNINIISLLHMISYKI